MADKTGLLLCELYSKKSSKSLFLSYLLPHKFGHIFVLSAFHKNMAQYAICYSFSVL